MRDADRANDETRLSSSSSSSDLSDTFRREYYMNEKNDQSQPSWRHSVRDKVYHNDEIINYLQRLSNAIRTASRDARAEKVNTWWSQIISVNPSTPQETYGETSHDATEYENDINIFQNQAKTLLRKRFPTSEEWLRDRVSKSMVYRRIRCVYIQARRQSAHHLSFANEPNVLKEDMSQEPIARFPRTNQKPTVTFEEPAVTASGSRKAIRPFSGVSKVDQTAVRKPPTTIMSTKTALNSAEDESLLLPPCPVKPDSFTDFTCPYCNFSLPVSEAVSHKWKYVFC